MAKKRSASEHPEFEHWMDGLQSAITDAHMEAASEFLGPELLPGLTPLLTPMVAIQCAVTTRAVLGAIRGVINAPLPPECANDVLQRSIVRILGEVAAEARVGREEEGVG